MMLSLISKTLYSIDMIFIMDKVFGGVNTIMGKLTDI